MRCKRRGRICCQLSLKWRCWKGDTWGRINAWMQGPSSGCSLMLWASELNRRQRLLLASTSAQFSRPATSASNCQVSRSERHFSTVNISPHKYWQCIPSCKQMCLGKKRLFVSVLSSSSFSSLQIGSSMLEGYRFCVNKAPTGCADHGSLLLQLHLRNIL